jgi:hypothetical protein
MTSMHERAALIGGIPHRVPGRVSAPPAVGAVPSAQPAAGLSCAACSLAVNFCVVPCLIGVESAEGAERTRRCPHDLKGASHDRSEVWRGLAPPGRGDLPVLIAAVSGRALAAADRR